MQWGCCRLASVFQLAASSVCQRGLTWSGLIKVDQRWWGEEAQEGMCVCWHHITSQHNTAMAPKSPKASCNSILLLLPLFFAVLLFQPSLSSSGDPHPSDRQVMTRNTQTDTNLRALKQQGAGGIVLLLMHIAQLAAF